MAESIDGRAPFNFIVPIRHPASVACRSLQHTALEHLFASLSGQRDRRFLCHVVVNPEQILPPLPPFVRRIEINLPPNDALASAKTVAESYRAIRADKGARVRAAFSKIHSDDYIMVVDDDDLISNRLVSFILGQPTRNPWVIDKGYAWEDDSSSVYEIDQFHRLCGSSLIVPAHHYKQAKLSALSSESDIQDALHELGSHMLIVNASVQGGKVTFNRIPFRAAIYRRGHDNSSEKNLKGNRSVVLRWSKHKLQNAAHKISDNFFFQSKGSITGPARTYRSRSVSLRQIADEFFGAGFYCSR